MDILYNILAAKEEFIDIDSIIEELDPENTGSIKLSSISSFQRRLSSFKIYDISCLDIGNVDDNADNDEYEDEILTNTDTQITSNDSSNLIEYKSITIKTKRTNHNHIIDENAIDDIDSDSEIDCNKVIMID